MLCYAMMYVVKDMLRLIVSTCNNILVHVITYYNYNFLKNEKKN